MANREISNELTSTGQKKTRLTIGMLPADINHKNDYSMWQGVVDAARRLDINVICFPGLQLQSPEEFDAQANVIYELVSAERLDGLVIMAGAITRYVGAEERRAFFERFSSLPIVTLESNMTGIPDIYVDFYDNMRKAVLHLIQVHNYRRIAFIRGPEEHQGASDRYRGYVDALAECGIPFDPALVTPPLINWDGRLGVTLLLDRQHADFEAVVAVNDGAAMAAIETLQERGINVPEQVAVIGFDDVDEGRWITPPLTTVPLATYTSGQQALEMVLALIEGKPVPEQVITPTELVIRQSCGCIDPIVTQAVVEPATLLPKDGAEQIPLATVLPDQEADILAAIKQTVKEEILKAGPDQIRQLLAAFAAEQSNPANGIFLPMLEQILSQTIALGGEIEAWQQVVSVLRRRISSYLPDNESLLWAENLWQQARILIGQVAQRKQGYQEVVAERRMTILREVGEALVTTFDSEALMNVLAHQLPRLNIRSAYLSLYEDPKHPAGQARLLMAYNQQGRIEIEAGSHSFSAPDLIPQKLWPDEPYSMVALPLYFQKDQLGFVLFESNSQDGPIYMALRGQISSALKGALLVEQEEKRARQLQTVTEVSTVVATILDTTELLQSVVDLTKASFNLYHTHIYLLNETPSLEEEGQEAVLVLAAGAGNVGRQMVAQGWRIPLKQEQSLVARAARTRQGVIENYVRNAPDWLPNPLLPQTHSELAVPMVAGDRVLGVLDIQSDRVNHFTDEDVRIQTTLATQVAVALQNSRSFAEQQQAKLLLAKRVRELNCLNEVGREIVEAPAVADLLQWVTERIPLAMQYPELCVVAIEYEGQVYGKPQAIELPCQIVNALRIGAEVMGRIYISYTKKHDFLDEESALLGGIASRVSGYIESRHLLEQIQQRAVEFEETTTFLDTVVDNIPLGIFIKRAEDLSYVGWNKGNEALVGLKKEEVLGKTDYDFFPPEMASHFVTKDRKALAGGKLVDIPEEPIDTVHGGARFLHTRKVPILGADGTPKYLLGISLDITERKQAEEALKESEERFRVIAETTPIPILISRAADGMILYGNEQLGQTLGWPITELIGRQTPDFYYDPADRKLLLEALKREGRLRDYELRIKKADGSTFWAMVFVQPLTFGDQPALLTALYDVTELRQTTEALARERDQFQILIDNIPDIIIFKDTQSRFIKMNRALANMLKLADPAEAVGKTDFDFWSAEEAQKFYDEEQQIIRTGQPVINREWPVPYAGGQVMWISESKIPLFDETGQNIGLVGIARDITERKRAEQDIIQQKEFFSKIINILPLGVMAKDVQNNFRFSIWNAKMEEMFGVKAAEMLGKTDYDYSDKEQADFYRKMDVAVIESGQVIDIPVEEITTVYGPRLAHTIKLPIFDNEGKPETLLVVLEDITERKAAEEALRASQERFALVVAGTQDGVWDWDIKNGTLYWSPRLKEMLGYKPDEIEIDFDTFSSLLHPEDAKTTGPALEAHLKHGTIYDVEQRLRAKSGEHIWFRVRGQAIWDEAGNPIRMTGSSIDITAQKAATAERERLLAEIEAAYRRYVRQEWEKYLGEQQGGWRIEHQLVDQPIEPASQSLDWLQHEVIREGKTRVVNGASNGHEVEPAIVAPITLRGQVIGTLSLQDIVPERRWTDEEMALVETVSEQLALTVENLRLFDTTQKRATREALTREIADKIRQANTVEEILETSVAELSKTLGVSRVFIDLTTEESAG